MPNPDAVVTTFLDAVQEQVDAYGPDYKMLAEVREQLPHAREGDAGAIRAIASFADYFMTSELGRLGREAVATLA